MKLTSEILDKWHTTDAAIGIRPGDVVVVRDRDGEIVLKPAAVLEIDTYSDEQIAEWDDRDRLAPEERQDVLRRLGVEK